MRTLLTIEVGVLLLTSSVVINCGTVIYCNYSRTVMSLSIQIEKNLSECMHSAHVVCGSVMVLVASLRATSQNTDSSVQKSFGAHPDKKKVGGFHHNLLSSHLALFFSILGV